MSHHFYEGKVYHKRFHPKKHSFTYSFFMLGVDLSDFESLKSRFFGLNKLNIFSFYAKDHFGKGEDFHANVDGILKQFNLPKPEKMHFFTLPRIMGFVFNPISVLLLFGEEKPNFMLVEVHNYNGGRIVYPVPLHVKNSTQFTGEVPKDMYVSPFLKRDGMYTFTLEYEPKKTALHIVLHEEGEKKLMASFSGETKEFSNKNILKLFSRYGYLTFFVVIGTLYQALKLYLKGLKWNSVTPQDQKKRY